MQYLLECPPRKLGHLENCHVCEAEAYTDKEEDVQTETRKKLIRRDKKKGKSKDGVARGTGLESIALGPVWLWEEMPDPARENG